MEKIKHKISGTYNYENLDNLENGRLIYIEEVESPVLVQSQYGWADGSVSRNFMVLYPPFRLLEFKAGNEYTLGSIVVECSAKLTLIGYIANTKRIPRIKDWQSIIKNTIKDMVNIIIEPLLLNKEITQTIYTKSSSSLEDGLIPSDTDDIKYSINNEKDLIEYCIKLNERFNLMKEIRKNDKQLYVNDSVEILIYKDSDCFDVIVGRRHETYNYLDIDEKYLKQILEMI